MEYPIDTYFSSQKNKYTVHFMNHAGLSMEEIEDIFAQFGTMYCTAAGDIHGMRFVVFSNLKDVIKCVKHLKNHELIKLLPEREKLNQQEDQSNNTNKCDNTKKKTAKSANKMKKNFHINERSKKRSHMALTDDEPITSKQQVDKEVADCYEKNDNGNSTKCSDIRSASWESAMLNTINNIATKNRNNDLIDDSCVNTPIHSEKSLRTRSIIYNDEMPGIIGGRTSEQGRSIESLDEISSSIYSTTEPKIVLAHHVVVANVHKDFGIHFILHLFEKYEPIAVSLMKTINQTGIRYCNVYFKNSQDAFQVEKVFDKTAICGKHLIVLRSHKLLEEVTKEY